MNKVVSAFLARLTYGESENVSKETQTKGVVETLARVYEKARNALEYRADHLVRRAAIERIIKRRLILDKNPESVADHLITELKWARYLGYAEINDELSVNLKKILEKYVNGLSHMLPQDWVSKIASAEIEETLNLNTDYHDFTLLAFQVIKQKVKIPDENIDLLVYFAVDKVYAGSDNEQIAYHILKMGGDWNLFNQIRTHKDLTRIIKFTRRQIPPLVLLRDIYFYSPSNFKKTISDEKDFKENANKVLEIQLAQLKGRISTASLRSIIYVFLTKMVVAIGVEIPFEILFYNHLSKIPLIINILFPPALMWAMTFRNQLPGLEEREKLVERTWFTLTNFEKIEKEGNTLTEKEEERGSFLYIIFSVLYFLVFFGIFWLIFFVLGIIGFTLASKVMFVFFLTIIAFFAYRISQIAKVYLWKEYSDKPSLIDIITLPILSIGSRLSQGLSKLNFLAFAFDFILEAPFKIILGFLDSWVQFLSLKKDEEIIE